MTLSIAKGKHPLVALLGLMAASLAILPLLPPILQDPSYHQFADQRTLLGIPNFWNVVSNLPFVLVGAMGLWQFGRDRGSLVLFLGVFLTGFGWTDDLRLYGWVQFFPCIALPLLFVAFPARYSGTSYWLIAAAFYAFAKLFEFYDHAIYSVGFILSGHTLKHFAAASACFAILRYFQTRRPVLDPRLD
jgi:hypothetical protein